MKKGALIRAYLGDWFRRKFKVHPETSKAINYAIFTQHNTRVKKNKNSGPFIMHLRLVKLKTYQKYTRLGRSADETIPQFSVQDQYH